MDSKRFDNLVCDTHKTYKAEFICSEITCFWLICHNCLKSHKIHLKYVKNLDEYIQENINHFKEILLKREICSEDLNKS